MRSLFFKGVTVFFLLLVATSIMMDQFKMDFGTVDYWNKHGVFFLVFITFFPRLTLLFSSVATGGVIWWIGFFFLPRVLVATLATIAYFHTNPLLVIMSWIIALGGEVFEKWGIGKNQFVVRTYRSGPRATYQYTESYEQPGKVLRKDDAIEAEFKKED
jgi:hypothetical protein